MGQLVSEIILNLGGNLAAKARLYGNSMSEFARKNQTAMGITSRSIETMSRGLDRIGNRYTTMAAGIVTGATLRSVANYEASLVRLGTNAQLTGDQVAGLDKRIKEVSNKKDIRVDTKEMLSAVDKLISLTGDVDFVNKNMENIGYTMQAFGTDATSSAELLAQFWEKNVRGADDVNKSLDELYSQFAVGKVGVDEIARVAPKLFSIIQMQGPKAISQMGALIQIFNKTKGSAEESVTSINAVFSDLSNANNIKFLKGVGVDVFKKGTREFKEPIQLLDEILKSADYDMVKLGKVFSGTSMEGLKALLVPDNQKLLHEMISGNYELGSTMDASAKNAKTFNAAMTALGNTGSQFADKELAKPVQELADAVNSLEPETVEYWLEFGKNFALVVGGVVALNKATQVGRDIRDIYGFVRGGKKGQPSSSGPGQFDIGGATPVYVVNMPGGSFGGPNIPPVIPPGEIPPGSKTPPSSKPPVNGDGVTFGRILSGASKLWMELEISNQLAHFAVDGSGLGKAARNSDTRKYFDNQPEMKSWSYAGLWEELKSSAAESQRFAQQQQTELYGNLNIRVSDDRVRVSQSGFNYPSLNVNVDNGRSMTGGD